MRARELPRALGCFFGDSGPFRLLVKGLCKKNAALQRSKKKPKKKNGDRHRETNEAVHAVRVRRPSRCAVRRVRRYGEERRCPHPAKSIARAEVPVPHAPQRKQAAPAHLAIPESDNAENTENTENTEKTEKTEAPEEPEEGHLEYIETDPWDARTAKLEATLEATRRLQNEQRFALLPKKEVMRPGETTSAHKRWEEGLMERALRPGSRIAPLDAKAGKACKAGKAGRPVLDQTPNLTQFV